MADDYIHPVVVRVEEDIHPSIEAPIRALRAGRNHYIHRLGITQRSARRPIERASVQYLVDFLDTQNIAAAADPPVTELVLLFIHLSHPSDGGVNVLREFFARSVTTLTKVTLYFCHFGSQDDASQLLAAFQTNRTVFDLTIERIRNLEGAALGACLSTLIQNMPQLQRLNCARNILRVDGIHAMQPTLQANRTLIELRLRECGMGDDGISLIADALVGNTTIYMLDISRNDISSVGLADITRLLETTRVKTIYVTGNVRLFNDDNTTQPFARVLSRHEFLRELDIASCRLGNKIHLIADALVGNTTLEGLDISDNAIYSTTGLDAITRMIESTKLKNVAFWGNQGIFRDAGATEHFVATLRHKSSTLQELPIIDEQDFWPRERRTTIYANINNSLTRNRNLNHVVGNLLLAPPRQLDHHQFRNNGTAAAVTTTTTAYLIKVWHKAITKLAAVPNNAGASAIFKLFQARPALLEKRLKRPAADAAAAAVSSGHEAAPKRTRL